MVRQAAPHNQQAGLVDSGLGVVVLVKAVIGTMLHDRRVRVGEMVLVLVARAWRGRLWRFFPPPAGPGLCIFPPLSDLCLGLRLFFLVALLFPLVPDLPGPRHGFPAYVSPG